MSSAQARCRPAHDVAPGGRPAPADAELLITEVAALAELLAEMVHLAGQRAVYPGHRETLAEQAMEHHSVRAALLALQEDGS
ncbi:MAG: hypothetical protein M3460_23870 [Actinomycetota bacterium]|nr:hypothetical protein [Actinomycetota bacterium]